MRFFTALLVLISSVSYAEDNLSVRMGSDLTHHKSTALYSLGYEEINEDRFMSKIGVGFWADSETGHKSSPFTEVLLGYKLGSNDEINLTPAAGFAFIGFTDDALSTTFEFTEELSIGYKNITVGYKHISNAGIRLPNQGRDYIFVNVTTTF